MNLRSLLQIGPALSCDLSALDVVCVLRLMRPDEGSKQLGFALIFANFPINRIGFALLNMNDEQYVTAHFFGHSSVAFWITNLAIWIFTIPPLVLAYRAIRNRLRPLWFAGFFVLPFVFVFVFAGMFLENWLLLDQKFLATPIIGVPYLVFVVEAVLLRSVRSLRPRYPRSCHRESYLNCLGRDVAGASVRWQLKNNDRLSEPVTPTA